MARDERAQPGELEDLGGAPALDAAARLRVLSIRGHISLAFPAQGGLGLVALGLLAVQGPLACLHSAAQCLKLNQRAALAK